MKNIIFIITSLISITSITFAIIIYYGINMDTSKNEFSNYQELKDSGVYYGGWLPEYIPKTSINIKEEHDFDTNSVFAIFQYDPAEILEVKKHCIATPEEDGYIKFFCPPFVGRINILVLHKNGNGYYESRTAYHDEVPKKL